MSKIAVCALAVLLAGCEGSLSLRRDRGGGSHDFGAQPDQAGQTPDASGAHCGNGSCEPGEDCASCAADCGGCAPQTVTVGAIEDAYVDEGKSDANFGSAQVLYTDESPDQHALLRFLVGSLPGAVLSAKLRLYVDNGSAGGPALYQTSDPWTESGVTWNNRPKPWGPAVANLGSVATGWVEIDLTGVVTSSGSYSFLLVPTSSDGADFQSRENSNAPQLVITTQGGPPPKPDAGAPDGSPDGSPPGPVGAFAFFAVGDTRSNQNIAQQNFQSMAQLDPKAIAVFNSGDLTADGDASQWQTHTNAVNLGSAGKIRLDLTGWDPSFIRYFGIVGNHDIHDSAWLSSWNTHLSGQKNLGTNGSGGIYFSVTHGNAIFIVLDSEHKSSGQTSWLQQTLAAASANPTVKWKFAFYHQPVYPCNYKSPWSSGIPWVRQFETHGVDVVFNGHAHTYERTCAMVGGKCQTGGVRYVISGGGGAGTGSVSPTKKLTVGTDSYDCSQILDSAKGSWHHYCHIQLDGGKLTYRCYQYNSTTTPEDTFTIVK